MQIDEVPGTVGISIDWRLSISSVLEVNVSITTLSRAPEMESLYIQ
jgi:hypothetical protein